MSVQYVQKELQEMIFISTLMIAIRVKQCFLVYVHFKFLTASGAFFFYIFRTTYVIQIVVDHLKNTDTYSSQNSRRFCTQVREEFDWIKESKESNLLLN